MVLRSEIPDNEKWAVNDIYATDELWNDDYKKMCEKCEQEPQNKDGAAKSAKALADLLKENESEEFIAEKLYVYAFMRYYEDTSNAVYQEMSGMAQMLVIRLEEKYAFVEPMILSIDDEVMNQYINDSALDLYKHKLKDILSQKEHSLSEKEERLLAMSEQMASAPGEIFSKFNNADVKFGKIKDENGEEAELTNGKYSVFMESQNREVRKSAFEALYKQYGGFINTLASTYYANVKQAQFYAKARKYDSTLNMYLSGSFIPTEVYTSLIKTVNDNMSLMHRYVSLRKKALGYDELHFYDIYAPMVKEYTMKVSYDEAQKISLDALSFLGKDYTDKVKEGFNNGWVDVRENKGKRSGAFSWGVYGTHPYVFLNYSDTLNDVFTVVHEMGHAMHTYYSNNTQPYIYSGYKIFVAEVASTCNETILMEYLLKNCEDINEKKYLINHYLELFKGTLFRQTMFAEFEMITHAKAEAGEVLSADSLCEIYRGLNEKYFGPDMVIDEEIAYEWARIPHFYTPFYVYQYATGVSAAVSIAKRIVNGDVKTLKGYKQFLSGGGSMHPIELLKLCGVDMTKTYVVEEALMVFKEVLDEAEKLF